MCVQPRNYCELSESTGDRRQPITYVCYGAIDRLAAWRETKTGGRNFRAESMYWLTLLGDRPFFGVANWRQERSLATNRLSMLTRVSVVLWSGIGTSIGKARESRRVLVYRLG